MDDKVLQALIHCYSNHNTQVLILNAQWEVLWANRPAEGMALPGVLGLPADSYQNGTYHFPMEGVLYECRLLCNAEDGYRIAEITPTTTDAVCRLDTDAITSAVQSMTAACTMLHKEMDEHDLYEHMHLLNVLIGNCYSIYRLVYLQKELDRLSGGALRSEGFSVNARLRRLYDETRKILRICAEVEADLGEDEVFLTGDSDFFSIAVLSAIVICYRDFRHYQQVRLALRHMGEDAVLSVTVAGKPAELPPGTEGMGKPENSDCDAERALLTAFCRLHEGSWMLGEQADSMSCTIRFRCEAKDGGNLMLFSARDQQEGSFYNKYEILLSRIHYQKRF